MRDGHHCDNVQISHHAEHIVGLASNNSSIVAGRCLMHQNVRKLLLKECLEINRNTTFFFFAAIANDLFGLSQLPVCFLVRVLLKAITKALFHYVDVHRVEQKSRAYLQV